MKPLSILLSGLLLLATQCLCAQTANLKWGKPSQAEWDMQAWGEAPDAEALILCKTVNVTYEITRSFSSYSSLSGDLESTGVEYVGNNNNHNAIVTYAVKMRTKILKEQGAHYANIDIVYFCEKADNSECDEISGLKVAAYSLNEKGKSVRRAIKPSNFTEERLDDNYKVYHIQVPDVKAGEIIEYQYELTSNRSNYIYDCSFQEDIPVLYAKCDMDIPAFLQFDMKVPRHPFIKSRVEPSAISGPQRTDMKAPDRYPSNHYIIEAHDILPKGLDLQRQGADTDAAKVEAGVGKLMDTKATLRLSHQLPAQIPAGQKHINLGR